MDKSDSRLHIEQIDKLMKAGRYSDAVFLVDKVDWRKEEDVKSLIQAAEAYRRTRRFDDAINILKMAHNRKPNNKKIVYLLCEIYFEGKDVVTAQVYLDRYQSMTDRSDWHYDALKYKRAIAYDLPVTEKIEILVGLKSKEPAAEQFRYELAKLYNQARQYAECAAECDELVLLFGDDGKFARKALELKKSSNVPLSKEQEALLRRLSLGITEGSGSGSSGNVKMMNTMDMSALNLESHLAEDIKTMKEEDRGTARRKKPEFHTKSLEQTIPPSTQEVFFSDKTEDISFTQYEMPVSRAADIREVKAPGQITPENDEIAEQLYSDENGQISFAEAADETFEDDKIPGQVTMDDLLSDWSKIKERNTQNLRKSIHDDVVEQTGKIFEKKKEQEESAEPEEEPGSIWKEVAELDDEFEESIKEEEAVEEIPEAVENEAETASVTTDENGNEYTEEAVSEENEFEAGEVNYEAEAVNSENTEEAEENVSNEPVSENTEVIAKKSGKHRAAEEKAVEADTEEAGESKEGEDSYDEESDEETAASTEVKDLSPEERKLFSQFLHPRSMRTQIANALENISLAAYVGNVIITTENVDTGAALAKAIVKFVKFADVNFSGVMSMINAADFNTKNVAQVLDKLNNGALVIKNANQLSNNSLIRLTQGINQEERGILIFLIDSKAEIKKLVGRQRTITDYFNIRIDVIAMSESALVDYGMKYANNLGYSIDEGFANMAFHKRVREAQAGNHTVTIAEVKGIVDEAIERNDKKAVSNLFRKMSKNYRDENGMIMLREKDFE
ncbi:MAG: tetratricopeptide repeat protein [Lachnospiraceae bacterium]|nr:tetratricopeptide repeat protein [Lachnospiraceae bacterium]